MSGTVTRRTVIAGAVASATVATTSSNTLHAAQPVIHDVKIKRFKFDPKVIQVKLGEVIRWTNKDLAPHTATAVELGWDTEKLTKGASAEITVTEGMETDYFCAYHPHMKATIEIL